MRDDQLWFDSKDGKLHLKGATTTNLSEIFGGTKTITDSLLAAQVLVTKFTVIEFHDACELQLAAHGYRVTETGTIGHLAKGSFDATIYSDFVVYETTSDLIIIVFPWAHTAKNGKRVRIFKEDGVSTPSVDTLCDLLIAFAAEKR